MRVVLLAAGAATRLRPLTDHLPKCLLAVGARTIVSRTVELLADRGFDRFTVVDGFCADQLRTALVEEFGGDRFTFVHNEQYASTNNAYSLWLARQTTSEPMLLLDSDVVFDSSVLDRLLAGHEPNRIALRTHGELGAEEMKVVAHPDGRVRAIGKDLDPADALGESVGIHWFGAGWCTRLFAALDRRMQTEVGRNEWYEAAFQELLDDGESLWPASLGDARAIEIDTAEDLARARAAFA